MGNKAISLNEVKGYCPPGMESIKNDCPKWDSSCECHGPVMTKGMVGWAAGTAGGPDFFINNYKRPAERWGTQHTNFGEIQDKESLRVVDLILKMNVHKSGGLRMLDEPVAFDLSFE